MTTERKKYPREDWPESRKEKQNNWRKLNRANLSCDIPRDVADAFRALCKAQGKSVSTALAAYVYTCLDDQPTSPGDDSQH